MILAAGTAGAQMQGGADWDSSSRQFHSLPGQTAVPQGSRNANLEQLNKILATPQLSAADRSIYLGLRAFLLSRLGRDADSQKDVAEMGKVMPQAWQVVMSALMPDLAGSGDRAAALRTMEYGLQRKPNDPWLLIGQAQIYMQLSDFQQASSLLDQSVAAANTPELRRLGQFYRGMANFNLGRFAEAAEDFSAAALDQRSTRNRLDALLWRYAAQVHTRQDARAALAKDAGSDNLENWPGAIVKFLLGRMSAGELEVVAESNDEAKRVNGKCAAAFYLAVDAVRRKDRQRAREQFQLAQARCATVSTYNWAAASELKRL